MQERTILFLKNNSTVNGILTGVFNNKYNLEDAFIDKDDMRFDIEIEESYIINIKNESLLM